MMAVDEPAGSSNQRVIVAALAKWEATEALRRTSIGDAADHWQVECNRSVDVIRDEIKTLGELGVARLIRDLAEAGNG